MLKSRKTLSSELKQVQLLLDDAPEGAFLERMSLGARLKDLKQQIEQLPLDVVRPTSTLTFRGEGVEGSHGIFATFGTNAAKNFTDAYSAVVAGLKENLRYMGRIPERASHDMLITGTAVGSFGFQIELPAFQPDLVFDGETLEEKAVKRIRDLMEYSAQGSDDEIAELLETVHPRAVRKVSDFLNFVANSNSTVALEVEGDFFRFDDVDKLKESAERLASENIVEADVSYYGSFMGVLPQSRNFEFKIAESGDVLRGKLSTEVENPEVLNDMLDKIVTVELKMVQVGQGRPRYTLISLNDIK